MILYRIRRISHSNKPYGSIHLCDNGLETLCGQWANENWYILGVLDKEDMLDSKMRPTCKKCIARFGEIDS